MSVDSSSTVEVVEWEPIDNLETYNPRGVRSWRVLGDDWRYLCRWYALLKDPKVDFTKYSEKLVVRKAGETIAEIMKRVVAGKMSHKFDTDEMTATSRQLYNRARRLLLSGADKGLANIVSPSAFKELDQKFSALPNSATKEDVAIFELAENMGLVGKEVKIRYLDHWEASDLPEADFAKIFSKRQVYLEDEGVVEHENDKYVFLKSMTKVEGLDDKDPQKPSWRYIGIVKSCIVPPLIIKGKVGEIKELESSLTRTYDQAFIAGE